MSLLRAGRRQAPNTPPQAPRRQWTAAIYTRANPVLRWLLASRWHGAMSDRILLLRITGRRTGRRYAIGVGYAENGDGTLDVLVSDASNRTWWRNFIGGGPVDVVLRGRERPAYAEAHRAPSPEFKAIADRSMTPIVGPGGAQRFFAVAAPVPGEGLRQEDLERLAGFAVGVTIVLDQEAEGEAGR
jgi:hypothetical protein